MDLSVFHFVSLTNPITIFVQCTVWKINIAVQYSSKQVLYGRVHQLTQRTNVYISDEFQHRTVAEQLRRGISDV